MDFWSDLDLKARRPELAPRKKRHEGGGYPGFGGSGGPPGGGGSGGGGGGGKMAILPQHHGLAKWNTDKYPL